MTFKKIIGKIHLYLGLASGIVVFIVSLTGCLYVFQEEICLLFQTGVFRNVEPLDAKFISPLAIKKKIEEAFDRDITYMNATVFPAGDRVSIVWVRDKERQYTSFLLNPYTGEIIDSSPYRITFWAIVLSLHTSLLIPEYGHHVVGIATIIFVVMLASGLFLWFPKSKKGYNQRFTIKWGASFKRLNYDLHNVPGFYMSLLALVIAITGLVWSYTWMDEAVYWIASGGKLPKEEKQITSVIQNPLEGSNNKIDSALVKIINGREDLRQYYIVYPRDSAGPYSLTFNSKQGSFYNKNDIYFLDQNTGETLDADLWQNKNIGEKLQAANYNIHVGAILGLPGKILAFFASLIATSLPVTGFMVWWGRRKLKPDTRIFRVTSLSRTLRTQMKRVSYIYRDTHS